LLLNNTNFVVACVKSEDANKGRIYIYDEDGIFLELDVFHVNNTTYTWMALLKTNDFMICYTDADDGNKGKYVVFNEDGDSVKAETEFDSSAIETYKIGDHMQRTQKRPDRVVRFFEIFLKFESDD
jgi:hypothetical protein